MIHIITIKPSKSTDYRTLFDRYSSVLEKFKKNFHLNAHNIYMLNVQFDTNEFYVRRMIILNLHLTNQNHDTFVYHSDY